MTWTNYQASLRQHLTNDDLSNFLQWSTIQATMFVGNAPYIEFEYDALLSSPNWRKWAKAIKEPMIGNPTMFNERTSGNLIHQAYHLKQWLDRTQQRLEDMSSIVEVGAGYGAMCLLCRRLGFKGVYCIYDLPELEAIQKYYLGNREDTLWLSDIWRIGLAEPCDLFIASHSLGEMPIVERERYLSQVAAKEYLFVSSYEYGGVDNQAWFNQLAGTINRDWKFYAHPFQENAFYQVGVEI